MTFTYMMMASVFLVGTVLGGPMVETEVSYEDVQMQKMEEVSTATTEMERSESSLWTSGGVLQRSSNLKYVTAIQKSSIWTAVRRRTLKISRKVNSDMIDKSPETMTDQELALLKQACHDALKCVAVDQLLVLKTIKQQPDGGHKPGVRTAITKITKVLTEYTNEYHEDRYEYFEVSESDDTSKVYQSVTTIVEDNQDLCKTHDDNASSDDSESNDASSDDSKSNDASYDDSSSGDSLSSDDQGKRIFQNFGTINNYNINEGTMNSAVVNVHPSDDKSSGTADGSKPETRDQGTNTDNSPTIVVKLGEENENAPENYNPNDDLPQEDDSQRYDSSQDDDSQNSMYNQDQERYYSQDSEIPDSPTIDNSVTETGAFSNNVTESGADYPENAQHNSLTVDNTNEGGCGDTNVDIASSGSTAKNEVHKGYVDEGNLNNGNMIVYNINKGTMNKGVVNRSSADNGVINIGTINKGPISYENSTNNSTNAASSTLNNLNVQQYVSDVNHMYSTFLESFP